MSESKIWLITGCSSGFGREIAHQALRSGDKVVVTARNSQELDEFKQAHPQNALVLNLDVTQPDQIKAAVNATLMQYGRIDVLLNSAGRGIFGAIEEVPETEIRKLFEINFFGLLNLIKAVLPTMRKQRSGHIINLTGVAGLVSTSFLGIYNASKYAVEGLSEALALELEPLGIHVTNIEPGPSRTAFLKRSFNQFDSIADYNEDRQTFSAIMKQYEGNQPGNPEKIAQVILQIANNPAPPVRVPLGKFAYERVHEKMANLTDSMMNWEQSAMDTDFKKNN